MRAADNMGPPEQRNQVSPPPRAIIHIPHASRYIPPDIRASILLSDEALDKELLKMTDAFTDELFAVDSILATPVVFPVSRLVADVERFVDDSLEPMAARGMGVIYWATSDGRPLRKHDASEKEQLLAEYYEPHHQKLRTAVQASLDYWGEALIIDAHSFASFPLRHELDQDCTRPDICVGSDPVHTPLKLINHALELFQKADFTRALNRPFSGALVPLPFYRRDHRVSSIMLELCRGLYMDESTGQRSETFNQFCKRFREVLTNLIREAVNDS
jgi:N-formylglutamate deformylase